MEVCAKGNRTIKQRVSKFGRDFQEKKKERKKTLLMLEMIQWFSFKKEMVCQENSWAVGVEA